MAERRIDPVNDPKRPDFLRQMGWGREKLRNLVKEGKLYEYEVSARDWRISQESIDQWLAGMAQREGA